MWDKLSPDSLDVIRLAMNGNYGLAERKWQAQLEAIRGDLRVPEPPKP